MHGSVIKKFHFTLYTPHLFLRLLRNNLFHGIPMYSHIALPLYAQLFTLNRIGEAPGLLNAALADQHLLRYHRTFLDRYLFGVEWDANRLIFCQFDCSSLSLLRLLMRCLLNRWSINRAPLNHNFLASNGYGNRLFLHHYHLANEDFADFNRLFVRLKRLFAQMNG